MRITFVIIGAVVTAGIIGQMPLGESRALGQVKKSDENAPTTEIEKLIKQLGSASAVAREKASKALLKIGVDALPLLKSAMKSNDTEIRRRAELLNAEIYEAWIRARADRAAKYGIDVVVERMVRKRNDLPEDDWQVLGRIIETVRDEGRAQGATPAKNLPHREGFHKMATQIAPEIKENYGFRASRLIAEDITTGHGIGGSLVVNGGKTKTATGSTVSIVIANGDVYWGGPAIASIIICDGNISVMGARGSILIARERIKIRSAVGTKDNVIHENYSKGFSHIRFFSVRDLGIQLAGGDGNQVGVINVDKDSLFGNAGFKVGDLIASINGEKITESEDARAMLRRGMADGNIVVGLHGNGSQIKVHIPW